MNKLIDALKECQLALDVIDLADLHLSSEAKEMINEALHKAKAAISSTPQDKPSEGDIHEWPYEGICGKCTNYRSKIDKDFLCDVCKSSGVKFVSITTQARKQCESLVRLRKSPQPQSGGILDKFLDFLEEDEVIEAKDKKHFKSYFLDTYLKSNP